MGVSGHVAGSENIREGVLQLRHSGTRVSFGKLPEGGRGISRLGSRCGLRDAWRSHTASEGGLSRLRHSGQVALSQPSREHFSRSITRDAWHSPKVVPKGLSKEVSKGWLPGWPS